MKTSINLMPERCRETLGRRRRVRLWITAYAVTVAAIWGAFLIVKSGRGAQLREHRALEAQVLLNWNRNEEAQGLLNSIQEVELRIERYNALAWPVRMSEVIDVVGAVTPETVTLTTLTLTPREEIRRPSNPKEKAPPPRTLLLVELEGVVLNDMEVASLVSGLDSHPLFESVVLDYSKPRDVDGVEARAFRMTSQIDLSVRYAFVDAFSEAMSQ